MPHRTRRVLLALLPFACLTGYVAPGASSREVRTVATTAAIDSALPNDNRSAAGRLRDRELTLALEARVVRWRPDPTVDSMATVQAFAEAGKPALVPGPLVRVPQGTRVRVTLRNLVPDSTLVVRGLRAGSVADDSLQLRPGETRVVEWTASVPGTYLYWGTTSGEPTIADRLGRDTQLTGVIVVDPAGTTPDPHERILVATLIDIWKDTALKTTEDVWEVAINGRSWPHTERLRHVVGDTVRWLLVNGTDRYHPMHLHGFHFRVLAKGSGTADTTYPESHRRLAVTEVLQPGTTARIEWVPVRPGNWLMHCHMIPHVTPWPVRADSTKHHGAHDPARHAEEAMAGLVVGITVEDGAPGDGAALASAAPAMRLLVQERRDGDSLHARGYVLQRGAEPARDSVEVPGTPLVLTRGEPRRITVVNRLAQPTTVHWHGLELESVFDGVSGWSGTGGQRAPLLAPGDSFTVTLVPPRAGTYIYHTHMDEDDQIGAGLYGALLVVEPGTRPDTVTDHLFVLGEAVANGKRAPAINGRHAPPPITLRAGVTHRLRFINIRVVVPAVARLVSDTTVLEWRPVAKDGADLPRALRVARPARQFIGVGETYDFEWTPTAGTRATLVVQVERARTAVIRQEIRVE